MTGKNTFSFKNLSKAQKAGFIGGGVALTAALGSVIATIFSEESDLLTNEEKAEASVETEVADGQEIESITEEYNMVNSDSEYTDAEEDIDGDFEIEEESYDLTFETEVNFSQSVSDDMTFDDAFAAARTDVGYGGWFNWNEQSYSTFTKEEWNSLSESEQQSYVDQVIEQSNIENAEWIESPIQEMEIAEEVEAVEEMKADEEIIINDEDIALDTEDIVETEVPQIEEELTAPDVVEDELAEDIIIVKPIRGADINGDGVVDAIVFDNDGDGNIDLVALDEDYDGTFESYMINEDGDEDLDVFVIDEGGDGIDDTDPVEEISDVVNMEDFVVLDDEDIPEDLSFIDDIFGNDDTQEDTIEEDLGFDDIGL